MKPTTQQRQSNDGTVARYDDPDRYEIHKGSNARGEMCWYIWDAFVGRRIVEYDNRGSVEDHEAALRVSHM